MKIGEAIRKRRKSLNLTLEQVANEAGTDTGNLSRLERGKQGFSEELLERVMKALRLKSVGELFLDEGPAVPPGAHEYRAPLEVPVVGTTQGGPPDRVWDELNYSVGYSDEYLEVASTDRHAYALRVVGDSMAPRIMEGEWILVEPSKTIYPGDDVVVKTDAGEVMVKRLVSDHGGRIVLASINEAFKQITLARADVVWMHYVGGIHPARAARQRVGAEIRTESYTGPGRRHHERHVGQERRQFAVHEEMAQYALPRPRQTLDVENVAFPAQVEPGAIEEPGTPLVQKERRS